MQTAEEMGAVHDRENRPGRFHELVRQWGDSLRIRGSWGWWLDRPNQIQNSQFKSAARIY
ncbi:hypothetical protein MA16_Dca003825 [Dendrobium catenatum]|uniref:Uncharacterized protein n=1 Tax=Dendrobium catenatum TaxID=906689 RepID=A0A2I0X1N3_9ASPA|nr:hypothetical protein MA16_Dca003825 [Dendrobium catenatum]